MKKSLRQDSKYDLTSRLNRLLKSLALRRARLERELMEVKALQERLGGKNA